MISLIHPSRGRPQKAFDTLGKWWQNYMRGVNFEHILSIDSSDPSKEKYHELFPPGYAVIESDNKSVVEATNVAAKQAKGDILIYLSDDFNCPADWIRLVESEFSKYSGPTLIKVDDCLQRFDVAVLTIPMMNRAFMEANGYFWHPDFKSMHVDEHLYWRAKKLNALQFAPHLKFPHDHHSVGKCENDDTYRRSEANWNHGKMTLKKHQAMGFSE